METWIQNAITDWKVDNVKMNPPATMADIEYTESVLNIIFPQDFKEFYLTLNGFDGLDWQRHMITFWPLKMMIEEYDEKENGFIGFADYSLKVNVIGFIRGKEGVYKIYPSVKDHGHEYIAPSFQDVVHMMNSNNDLIY